MAVASHALRQDGIVEAVDAWGPELSSILARLPPSAGLNPLQKAASKGLYVLMFVAAGPVAAQTGAPSEAPTTAETPTTAVAPTAATLSYPPEYFKEFQPTSALDMVQRLPGFTYNKGVTDVRGFGGTGGNVLVDGERPAAKSIPLDDILRRIPVGAVLRIEVVRGGAPGIDMQGQTVIANVVRGSSGSSSLAIEALTKFYTDHLPAAVGRIEGSRRKGPLSLEGSLHLRNEKEQMNAGFGRLVQRNAANATLVAGDFEADWEREFAQASGAAEYRFPDDVLRFNLGGLYEQQDRKDLATLRDAGGADFVDQLRNIVTNRQYEGGIDFEHTFSPSLSGRVLVLRTRKIDSQDANQTNRGPAQLSTERSVQDEAIGRATLTQEASANLTLEVGVEGVLNSLEATSSLTRNGVPVVLPSANVLVEEKRGEAFGTVRWRPSKSLGFDAGLRFEASTISQTGDVNQSRTLKFLKPRLSVSYDIWDGLQLRFRAERTVSQLNFKDFAATAALDTGSASAGNPNLMPETGLVFEAAAEQRFWTAGSFVVTFSRAYVKDVTDFIPIAGFDAPGNLGDGTRDELKLSLSSPLARLGLKGTSIRFNGTWRWSSVPDPVTGLNRRISRQRPFEGDILLTQELPALKSVLSVEGTFGFEEVSFRRSEIRTERDGAPFKIYWDVTPRSDLSIRLQLENFLFKTRSRERILFNGPRSAGDIRLIEDRSATLDPFIMMRVRKTF